MNSPRDSWRYVICIDGKFLSCLPTMRSYFTVEQRKNAVQIIGHDEADKWVESLWLWFKIIAYKAEI